MAMFDMDELKAQVDAAWKDNVRITEEVDRLTRRYNDAIREEQELFLHYRIHPLGETLQLYRDKGKVRAAAQIERDERAAKRSPIYEKWSLLNRRYQQIVQLRKLAADLSADGINLFDVL